MNKIVKSIACVTCALGLLVTGAACDFSSFGLSAYELAVKNGTFTGTEAEWLASLQGAKGDDGEDLNIYDIYETALEKGAIEEGTTFSEFLDIYFDGLDLSVVENNDTVQISENMMSVVNVVSVFTQGSGYKQEKYLGAGSGVIIELDREKGNAVVVTNYHVVYDSAAGSTYGGDVASAIWLYLYGDLVGVDLDEGDLYGDGIKAQYIGGSAIHDVAVLQIQNSDVIKNSIATEAKIGNSNDVKVGEKVYAIGNAEGGGISVSGGLISVDSEYISMTSTENENTETDYRVMRTDAAINHGNSGGGLFNAKGELIGITNAKTVAEDVDNIGYALPISSVMAVIDNIRENNGKLKSAKLGITVQTTDSSAVWNADGTVGIEEKISVAEIEKVGKAAHGLLKVNDVLVSAKHIRNGNVLGERKLTRRFFLIDMLLNVRLGDQMVLTVKRGGQEQDITINFNSSKYFDN